MAIIDVPGFVADLKDHAVDHAFHVHDERHYVETYSLRQAWEIDLHPEDACGGPLDLHLALEVEPRVLLAFEDRMLEQPDGADPIEGFSFPLVFTWALPPLRHPPFRRSSAPCRKSRAARVGCRAQLLALRSEARGQRI